MRLFGVSAYPIRWRQLLRSASLLVLLIVLEGTGTLVWFLVRPSEPANRVFLSYSLERWFLILGTATLIFAFLFALWAIRFRTGWTESFLKFFERPVRARNLLLAVTSLFVITSGLMLWLPLHAGSRAYFTGMLPVLLWGFLILAQVWVFLIAVYWQTLLETFAVYFPVSRETQFFSFGASSRYLLLSLLGISLVYLVLQLRSYLEVREATLIGDSWSYLYGASLSLSDPAFFSERRPWGILLMFKILGSSQARIELFQLSVSTLAWLGLSWVFIRSIQSQWVKAIGFTLILGFSLTPTVQVWNHTVLSESLSISLMVLILAAFVGLSQQWKWRSIWLLVVFFLLWMSFREANAYIAIFVAATLFVVGWIYRRFRAYWLLSFFIAVIFLFNHQLSSAYALPRWALPLAEVITQRILPEREYRDYFIENGMPVTPELMALSGERANSNDYAVINSPKLKKFTRWLFDDARNVYAKFLITHPAYAIRSPLADIQVLLGYDYFQGIPVPAYLPALPAWLNELFYPQSWLWVFLGLSVIVMVVSGIALQTNVRIHWFILMFLLLSIPHLYLVWHGDALDVERHAALANIQFHLGVWLLFVLLLDRFIVTTSTMAHYQREVRKLGDGRAP